MESDLPAPKIIVLSEHAGIYRAIEVCLRQRLNLETEWVEIPAEKKDLNARREPLPGLIVAVDLSPKLQPLVALARTGLFVQLRQISVLIISGYPFPSDAELKLYHLDLPFTPESLCRKVLKILQENQGSRWQLPAAGPDEAGAGVNQTNSPPL